MSDHANGKPLPSEVVLNRLEQLIHNEFTFRRDMLHRLTDPRRDYNAEFGHPESSRLTPQFYRDLYDRHPIAARVVELMPHECWQVQPLIYETEDASNVTPFEADWDDLHRSLRGQSWYQDEAGSPVWGALRRFDVDSRIGCFGLLLIGIDDGKPLSEPADGVEEALVRPVGDRKGRARRKKSRNVLYLRSFDESCVTVVRYVNDEASPRHGQPEMYQITLFDPMDRQRSGDRGVGISKEVHWTRVIHKHSDGGQPAMQQVVNNLINLVKVYGADAEAYYKNCLLKLILETQPQLGGEPQMDRAAMQDAFEQFGNGMQPYLGLIGWNAKSIPPAVVDPTPHVKTQLEAISIRLECPMRVFMGSERGELSSGQDDSDWNGRVAGRNQNELLPNEIIPFVDRLIAMSCLTEPEGYSAEWPSLSEMGAKDKADILLKRTQALSTYVGGNVEAVIPPMDFLTREMGYDEEEAKAILEEAELLQEQRAEEQAALAEEIGTVVQPGEVPQDGQAQDGKLQGGDGQQPNGQDMTGVPRGG